MDKIEQKRIEEDLEASMNQEVLLLKGLTDDFTKNLDCIGSAYLNVSHHGVAMAVKSSCLKPERLDETGTLWWPESGIKVDTERLESTYAVDHSVMGAGVIECDFERTANGFSVAFLSNDYREDLFELITEAYAQERVKAAALQRQRFLKRPNFDACACCADRADRIRKNTEGHPVSKILSMYAGTASKLRFHLAADHVDMLCAWAIDEIRCLSGVIVCSGAKHVLRLDASMIHTIQIMNSVKGGTTYSLMKCYHSLGGLMLEISLEGECHSEQWHQICLAADSSYHSISDIPSTS